MMIPQKMRLKRLMLPQYLVGDTMVLHVHFQIIHLLFKFAFTLHALTMNIIQFLGNVIITFFFTIIMIGNVFKNHGFIGQSFISCLIIFFRLLLLLSLPNVIQHIILQGMCQIISIRIIEAFADLDLLEQFNILNFLFLILL